MATSEFKKLAPGKIETEAAAQVAKEEKFIIDFVKDSYFLYLEDKRHANLPKQYEKNPLDIFNDFPLTDEDLIEKKSDIEVVPDFLDSDIEENIKNASSVVSDQENLLEKSSEARKTKQSFKTKNEARKKRAEAKKKKTVEKEKSKKGKKAIVEIKLIEKKIISKEKKENVATITPAKRTSIEEPNTLPEEEVSSVEMALTKVLKEAQAISNLNLSTSLFYYFGTEEPSLSSIELTEKYFWKGFGNEYAQYGEDLFLIGDRVPFFWRGLEEIETSLLKVNETVDFIVKAVNIGLGYKLFSRDYFGENLNKSLGNKIGVIQISQYFSWDGASIAYCFRDYLKKEIRKKLVSNSSIVSFCRGTKRDLNFKKLNHNNDYFKKYYEKYKKIGSYPETERQEKYEALKNETKEFLLSYLDPGNLLVIDTNVENKYHMTKGKKLALCAEKAVFFYPEEYNPFYKIGMETTSNNIIRVGLVVYRGDTNDYKAILDMYNQEYKKTTGNFYFEYNDTDIIQSTFKKEKYDILNDGLSDVYKFLEEDFVFKKDKEEEVEFLSNPEIKYIEKG